MYTFFDTGQLRELENDNDREAEDAKNVEIEGIGWPHARKRTVSGLLLKNTGLYYYVIRMIVN